MFLIYYFWSNLKLQVKIEQIYKTVATVECEALKQIPAIQRRRLSPLAKLAPNSALNALADYDVDYIVWVSQFGDELKTLTILEDILFFKGKRHRLHNFLHLCIMLGCILFLKKIKRFRQA